MNLLLLGPFAGDWAHEISVFRPWARWISSVIDHDRVYLSTHANRTFLYDWVPKENITSIYGEFSRDEFSQTGYTYTGLTHRDYMLLVRRFKDHINEKVKGKKHIDNYYLKYTKSNLMFYPIYNKIFEKITVPSINIIAEDYIAFIPDIDENEIRLIEIYEALKKEYNVVVVGDMKCHLPDENVILKCPDYFENGYKYIMRYLENAKIIICPTGHWTYLCNLQNRPVFSWGQNVGQYREDGVLNLGNRNCYTYVTNYDTSANSIINVAKHFIDKFIGR